MSARRRRVAGWGLGLSALFIVLRYLPAFLGAPTGEPISEEFAQDPTMYWVIVFLDLGVVVPVTAAAGVGLRRGAGWARKAVCGIAAWYAFVPLSVWAMGAVMLLEGDPNASVASLAVFSLAAVLFTGFAAWIYRPLFAGGPDSRRPADPAEA